MEKDVNSWDQRNDVKSWDQGKSVKSWDQRNDVKGRIENERACKECHGDKWENIETCRYFVRNCIWMNVITYSIQYIYIHATLVVVEAPKQGAKVEEDEVSELVLTDDFVGTSETLH